MVGIKPERTELSNAPPIRERGIHDLFSACSNYLLGHFQVCPGRHSSSAPPMISLHSGLEKQTFDPGDQLIAKVPGLAVSLDQQSFLFHLTLKRRVLTDIQDTHVYLVRLTPPPKVSAQKGTTLTMPSSI